jgi:predicted metalloendopeptidase
MTRWSVLNSSLLLLLDFAGARAESPAAAGGQTQPQLAAEVLSAMDPSADPCQDFYRYACGAWLEKTELPADRSRWTRSFSVIDERNREIVRDLLQEAGQNPAGDADRTRIGNYYSSCMNQAAIEQAGTAPLQPLLEQIAKVDGPVALMALSGKLQRQGIGALFGFGVLPDFKRPDLNIAFFVQGGLGMPDRDYYVSEDPKKRELLQAYEKHVARMLGLLGESEPQAARHAAQVVAFETELAKASRPREEMRIPEKLYNKIDISGLQQLTPALDWNRFLIGTGYPDIVEINVATPEFFEALERQTTTADPELLQAYLRWQLAHASADLLPAEFVSANFEFYGRTLSGQQEIEPRWKRCVDATELALGEAIGKLYVAREFAGPSKQIALDMIHDLENSFAANLPQLSWMDDKTRERALEKKNALGNKIGYPEEWRDYSSVQIGPDNYFQNAMAAFEFEFKRQADKIGKPVDRTEWGMTPQTVNAYYSPLLNEIVFPAGILQPPFFHKDFPAAMNYGAIGTVMGHELTHGFDDQGRKFDPKGELREWWEPAASEKFEANADCVRQQYSQYEIEPGVQVNGKLTAGENIADIGGLKQSYVAYKEWEKRHGGPGPSVGALTADQLFFVAHGQVWCSLITPEQARLRITTDPHSPGQFRVIGPISNHPAFGAAFSCPAGSPMNPPTKCIVW